MSDDLFILASLNWQSLQRLPLSLLLIVLSVALTVWLYPPQMRGIRMGWRWVLPSLRAAAMLVVVIALLQPVINRPKSSEEQGAIVVLIDNSISMSVVDQRRSPAERVAMATALGRISDNREIERISSLQADVDRLIALAESAAQARSETDYAKLAGRTGDTAQQRLEKIILEIAETARSALGKNSESGVSGALPTLLSSIAETKSAHGEGQWFEQLSARIRNVNEQIGREREESYGRLFKEDAVVHDAAEEVAGLTRFALANAVLARTGKSLTAHLSADKPIFAFTLGDKLTPIKLEEGLKIPQNVMADGSYTNLIAGVRAAIDRLDGTPVRGIILLSDGRQTAGVASVGAGLSGIDVPIYSINVSAPGGIKDLSLSQLTAPNSAFAGETITARVQVRQQGIQNAQADINFGLGDASQFHKQAVPDERPVAVEFKQKLQGEGSQKIVVSAKEIPGEASSLNNTIERWIKVQDRQLKIAVFAGEASWDFQYVRNAVLRTPWAAVKEGILSGPGANLPLSTEEILKQDVLLLFDVAATSLSSPQWDAVMRLASERGGSVILVAGHSHLPGEYATGAVTAGLLPYTGSNPPTWRTWPGERPTFHFIPSAAGSTFDAFKLTDDDEPVARHWQQLPAMFSYLPISPLKPNTRSLLAEADSGLAMLTESRVGIGRCFFMGANETWRWRYKTGERDMDRFWLQLIRYAAEEPYSVTVNGVSLDADVVAASPQQSVQVRGRVLDDRGMPLAVQQCQLKIVQGDRTLRTQQMSEAIKGSGRFVTTISNLPAGEYRLILDAGENLPRPAVALSVHNSMESETSNLSGDDAVLRRMSSISGGEYFRLDQVDGLVDRLNNSRFARSQIVETKLWDSAYLYWFVLGCFGIEWALRKKFGLA